MTILGTIVAYTSLLKRVICFCAFVYISLGQASRPVSTTNKRLTGHRGETKFNAVPWRFTFILRSYFVHKHRCKWSKGGGRSKQTSGVYTRENDRRPVFTAGSNAARSDSRWNLADGPDDGSNGSSFMNIQCLLPISRFDYAERRHARPFAAIVCVGRFLNSSRVSRYRGSSFFISRAPTELRRTSVFRVAERTNEGSNRVA